MLLLPIVLVDYCILTGCIKAPAKERVRSGTASEADPDVVGQGGEEGPGSSQWTQHQLGGGLLSLIFNVF